MCTYVLQYCNIIVDRTRAINVGAHDKKGGHDRQLLLPGGQPHRRVKGDPSVSPGCVDPSTVLENSSHEGQGLSERGGSGTHARKGGGQK